MNPHQLTVLIAVAALLGSVAVVALNETPVVEPGRPGTTASAPPILVASVPPIGDFEREFHVNYENPFVPYNERVADRVAQDPVERAKRPPRQPARPTPPPEKPPIMVEPAKLVLPARRDTAPGTPECLGIVRHGPSGQSVLMARLTGEIAQPLGVGDVIGGWTLKEIGAGVAHFERPDGSEETLPVGSATTPVGLPVQAPGAPVAPKAPQAQSVPAPMTTGPSAPTPAPAGDPRMRPKP